MSGGRLIPYGRLAAFYFFYFSSLGALLPFWGLYLRDLGLSHTRIGTVMALLSATKVAAPNLLGWIADLSGRRIAWIRLACLLAATFFLPLVRTVDYLEILLAMLAFGVCWSAALSQFEAVTLAHLGSISKRYSWVRLWGSLGFIAAVLGVGWVLDRYGSTPLPHTVAVLLVLIWFSSQLVPEPPQAQNVSKEHLHWQRLLWRRPVVAFLMAVFLIQVAHGPYYVFYSIHLKEHGYTSRMIGGLWSLGVVAEILLFFTFPWLLRYLSLKILWLGSILLGSVRWLVIGFFVDELAWLVAAQSLHAVTFAVNHAVAMQLLREFFGSQHQGKGQALYSSLSFGLGSMVGSYLAGFYWQIMGAQWVYGGAATVSLLAFMVALMVKAR